MSIFHRYMYTLCMQSVFYRSFHLRKYLLRMASRTCLKLDKSIINSGLLESIDYILTDCDGVLWMGNNPIPGSVKAMNALKNKGKHIIYVTNNNSKTREEYLKKCEKLGFPATLDDIICTAHCVASYLKSINFHKKVYVFGGTGIVKELDKVNIRCLPIGPDPVPDQLLPWLEELKLDPEVGAVVVGFDQHVSYPKLAKAASYVKNQDILFIATNKDEQFPTKNQNIVVPGTGTFVIAIETVSGRKAISVGKPEKFMLDCIKLTHPDIDFSRCMMIGDRLNTDIFFGSRHGLKTLLVLSGVHSLEDVPENQESSDPERNLSIPDYYLQSLGDILPLIS